MQSPAQRPARGFLHRSIPRFASKVEFCCIKRVVSALVKHIEDIAPPLRRFLFHGNTTAFLQVPILVSGIRVQPSVRFVFFPLILKRWTILF